MFRQLNCVLLLLCVMSLVALRKLSEVRKSTERAVYATVCYRELKKKRKRKTYFEIRPEAVEVGSLVHGHSVIRPEPAGVCDYRYFESETRLLICL